MFIIQKEMTRPSAELLREFEALSTPLVVDSMGKIKIQKNPAIKDWIERVQKNGRGCFNCSENVSQAQNGCKLI